MPNHRNKIIIYGVIIMETEKLVYESAWTIDDQAYIDEQIALNPECLEIDLDNLDLNEFFAE